MSTDQPIVRPNLMHLNTAESPIKGQGHGGGGGCGCGGHGGGGCGGGGRASRDYVVIEPIAGAEKVAQPEATA